MRIGRGEDCDLSVHDPRASRVHCVVEAFEGGFRLVDPGSRNGTAVNGAVVSQVRLTAGDVIRIGATEIRFDRARSRSAAPTGAPSPRLARGRTARRADARPASPRRRATPLIAAAAAALVLLGGWIAIRATSSGDRATETAIAGTETIARVPDAAHDPSDTRPAWDGYVLPRGEDRETAGDTSSEAPRSEVAASGAGSTGARNTGARNAGARNAEGLAAVAEVDTPAGPEAEIGAEIDVEIEVPPGDLARPRIDRRTAFLALEDVKARVRSGAYDEARAILDDLADTDLEEDVRLQVDDRRRDVELLVSLRSQVAKAFRAGPPSAPRVRVRGRRVTAADERGLRFEDGSELAWASAPPDAIVAVGSACRPTVEGTLALAVHCFAHDELEARAHTLLEELWLARPGAKKSIDEVLARHLGIAVPRDGFRVWDHRWVTPLRYDLLARESRFAEYRTAMIGGDANERREAYDALVAMGEPGIRALREDLPEAREDLHRMLRATKTFADLADLRRERIALETLREQLLDFVFDFEAYPDVFEPPAASPETAAAYRRTQALIDAKERELAAAWRNAGKRTVRLSGPFAARLVELRECLAWCRDQRANAPLADESSRFLEWIPATWDTVQARSFPLEEGDAEAWDASLAALAYNDGHDAFGSRADHEMLARTNEYRMLAGRPALRVDEALMRSASAHSREMSTLGYFAHESPTAAFSTPERRAEHHGFVGVGTGENIARHRADAAGTLALWKRSPPHHRNLLRRRWTCAGAGRSGPYWTLNFGHP